MDETGRSGWFKGIGAFFGGLGGLAALLTFLCSGKQPACWCPGADPATCGTASAAANEGGAGGTGGGDGTSVSSASGGTAVDASSNARGAVDGSGSSALTHSGWVVQVATNDEASEAQGSLIVVRRDLGKEGTVYRTRGNFVTVVGNYANREAAQAAAQRFTKDMGWRYGAGARNLEVLCEKPEPAEIATGGVSLKFIDCR